jgi:hypothetical protein
MTTGVMLHVVQYTGADDNYVATATLDISEPNAWRCRCGAAADDFTMIARIRAPATLSCARCHSMLAALLIEVEQR